jgi:hypothetical protein
VPLRTKAEDEKNIKNKTITGEGFFLFYIESFATILLFFGQVWVEERDFGFGIMTFS